MPLEYLRAIERDALPILECVPENVDKLRVLNAAGMVEVQLAPVDAPVQTARVLCVTGLGCATLRAPSVPRSSPRPSLRIPEPIDSD
ncbi:uvs104 domain protein [Acidovorax sp. RAC01]|nr:uvs104 domain protein [Acidovorax sp. RAC01]